MADHDAWASGSGLDDHTWLREEIKRVADPDSVKLNVIQLASMGIADQSHALATPFKWKCNARHFMVTDFGDEKRCRYCQSIEEHEVDHPLFWRGNIPIYREDLSWK